MRLTPTLPLALAAASMAGPVWGDDFDVRVAMREKAAATYYVPAGIHGFGPVEFMVDTGSGYMTINEQTLEVLQREGRARYVKQLIGVLADGSEVEVPVYSIEHIRIGPSCWVRDVEAAVFPGDSRQILGLSALRKVAPFIFSTDPPGLTLSRCAATPIESTEEPALSAVIRRP